MLIEKMEPNFEFKDERGEIIQLVREGFKQFNVITSHANVIRGGHYHKVNKEAFYIVSGKCVVRGWNAKGDQDEQLFCSGDMFQIEPFVMHSFKYLEETLLVSMYSSGVEIEENMDIFTSYDDLMKCELLM